MISTGGERMVISQGRLLLDKIGKQQQLRQPALFLIHNYAGKQDFHF